MPNNCSKTDKRGQGADLGIHFSSPESKRTMSSLSLWFALSSTSLLILHINTLVFPANIHLVANVEWKLLWGSFECSEDFGWKPS